MYMLYLSLGFNDSAGCLFVVHSFVEHNGVGHAQAKFGSLPTDEHISSNTRTLKVLVMS